MVDERAGNLAITYGSYTDPELREKHNIALDERNMSQAELLARLSIDKQNDFFGSLTAEETELLLTDWKFWARPKQRLPEGNWGTWLIMAGRGFGKTRTGAETIRIWQENGFSNFALIGQTKADVRDVMLLGESGLISISPKHNKPVYIASRRVVEWPNGAKAHLYSADEPEQLRGPQHEKGWIDEPVKYSQLRELLDMYEFGLRIGSNPQSVVTTTPKPLVELKEMVNDPDTVITTGSSFENLSNLSERFIKRVIKRYEGTRLGRQELYAELFSDVVGALWTYDSIHRNRVREAPDLVRVVTAIDPATTANKRSDETGIITAGLDAAGHIYVISDASLKAKADVWAATAVREYNANLSDLLIGEANNGGDLIEIVIGIYSKTVNYLKVHAARGKHTRAEPVAALYEKGLVHHVGSIIALEKLETEMTEWVPGEESPNRMDALVWAISALVFDDTGEPGELKALERFM